jgi:hypothetical protein
MVATIDQIIDLLHTLTDDGKLAWWETDEDDIIRCSFEDPRGWHFGFHIVPSAFPRNHILIWWMGEYSFCVQDLKGLRGKVVPLKMYTLSGSFPEPFPEEGNHMVHILERLQDFAREVLPKASVVEIYLVEGDWEW